jgi:hypothetical protein
MKRMAIAVVILAVGAAGCGSSSTPTNPSNLTVYTIQLLPSNEVPPVTNAENVARGTAVITIHKDTNTIDFQVSMNSFPAGSQLTAAHIHHAPAGVAAGVFFGTPLSAANAPALVNGAATLSYTGTQPTADQVTQILADPAGFYFNVHTTSNGSGVMRGQLQ